MGRPLRSHETVTGKSPPVIVHCTETGSPALRTSSPNVKGVIFGGTAMRWDRAIFGVAELKKKKRLT